MPAELQQNAADCFFRRSRTSVEEAPASEVRLWERAHGRAPRHIDVLSSGDDLHESFHLLPACALLHKSGDKVVGVHIGGMGRVQSLEFSDSRNGGLKCLRSSVNLAQRGKTSVVEYAVAIHF